jgi:hypothetical protein
MSSLHMAACRTTVQRGHGEMLKLGVQRLPPGPLLLCLGGVLLPLPPPQLLPLPEMLRALHTFAPAKGCPAPWHLDSAEPCVPQRLASRPSSFLHG